MMTTSSSSSDCEDGGGGAWDDDDDLLAMLNDNDDDAANVGAFTNAAASRVGEDTAGHDTVTAVPHNATTSHAATADIDNNGWDDDKDLDVDMGENENLNSCGHHHKNDDDVVTELQDPTSAAGNRAISTNNTTPTKNKDSTVEEWNFDEDEDIFNENNLDLGDDFEETKVYEGNKRDSSQEMSPPPSPMPYSPSWHVRKNKYITQQLHPQLQEQKTISTSETNGNNITSNDDNRLITANNGNDASGAAGWSDDEYSFDDDEDKVGEDDEEKVGNDDEEDADDLNLTLSSAPLPSLMVPPPPHPKPLPPSPFPSVQSPPVAHRTRAKSSHLQGSKQTSTFVVEEVEEDIRSSNGIVPSSPLLFFNPIQRRNHQMLSRYMSSLHDSNFVTRLHQQLHLHQQRDDSGGGGGSTAASDLRSYYSARPGLRKYTLSVELDRMEYTLVLSNGKLVCDKDVIRSYFGVNEDGEAIGAGGSDDVGGSEEDAITSEELLIRSANQSLLADLLVALTGAEDDIITRNVIGGGDGYDNGDSFFSDEEFPNQEKNSTALILSGPSLCMTSVAESCQFKVDLQCGLVEAVCSLAISIPYNEHNNSGDILAPDEIEIANGRLVLAKAKVSVRFRPGGEGVGCNDEPTVQYAVRSVSPLLTSDSALLQKAAKSLARDQDDPFFPNEYADIDSKDGAADARDLFLLSHHLADSGLLVVSDHFDRLRDAAAAKSTGFRSALRQLDGVTNVSSKIQGLGRFGLALPSAEEIEAAEQEAVGAARHLPRPPPPPGAEFRFRLSGNVASGGSAMIQSTDMRIPPPPPPRRRPQPPVPPPPPPPHHSIPSRTETSSRPRPILGGLLMSGLSRLAAAATQPDDQNDSHASWEGTGGGGGGGTGLTPPSSPRNSNALSVSDIPRLYRKEDDGGSTAPTGALLHPRQNINAVENPAIVPPIPSSSKTNNDEQESGRIDDGHDDDAGWSDEEFDFEDGGYDDGDGTGDGDEQELVAKLANTKSGSFVPPIDNNIDGARDRSISHEVIVGSSTSYEHSISLYENHRYENGGAKRMLLDTPTPPSSFEQQHSNPTFFQHHSRTFEEEFVIVLKEKIDAECQEMKVQGRMKRWTPISEDPLLRQQLMEVMVAQIQS